MIHCPRCGKANGDDFRFCLGCGADLVAAAQAVADEPRGRMPLVPPPPRAPSARARALIHAYTGRQAVLRLLGLVFTALGVVLFGVFGAGAAQDAAITLLGHTAPGVVVGVRTNMSVSFGGAHPREVTFTRGDVRGTSSSMDASWADALSPGQPVEVEYVSFLPGAARVRGTAVSSIGPFGWMPLLWIVVGGPLLFLAIRSNRREIRAFKIGAATVGRVTTLALDHTTRINGRHPAVLRWEFDVDGKKFTGALSHMDAAVLSPLVVDGKLPVVYDAADPAINTVYVE